MVVGEEGDQAARKASSCLARLYHCDGRTVLTADNSAENRAWLRARFPGKDLQPASAAHVQAAIIAACGETLRTEAVEGLARRLPELSARRVVSRPQILIFAGLTVLLLAAALRNPLAVLQGMTLLLAAAFVISGLFRALLAWLGSGGPSRDLPRPCHGLPAYTILVPLYHEAQVLPGLVLALRGLDYPAHLLDIKLVLEADDAETIAAAEACGDGCEIIRVPNHGPRTKPKAPIMRCNSRAANIW